MSEALQDLRGEWEASDNLAYHERMAGTAHHVIDKRIVSPDDKRFHLAYDTILTGRGPGGSVKALGPPGTVKTTFGNLLFGEHRRIDMDKNDTEASLFGNPSQMQVGKFIAGKFQEQGLADPDDPVVFINEVGNNRNTRMLLRLWDANRGSLYIGGEDVKMEGAGFYATTNFPNGIDVFEMGEALKSRFAGEILTGDLDEDRARQVQAFQPNGVAKAGPLLPKAEVRLALADLVREAYENPEVDNGRTVVSNYTVDLIKSLNESGLVVGEDSSPISMSDARFGTALETAARANMFYSKHIEAGTPISPLHVARVAAFVMPTSVKLSNVARELIGDQIDRGVTDMEAAIAVRRYVARTAFDVAIGAERARIADQRGTFMTAEQEADLLASHMAKYSYADPNALDIDIDQILLGESNADAAHQQAAPAKEENRGRLRNLIRR